MTVALLIYIFVYNFKVSKINSISEVKYSMLQTYDVMFT